MRYHTIQEHDRRALIRIMCRALAVPPLAAMPGENSPDVRGATNRAFVPEIWVLHGESRHTYCSPSICHALFQQGQRDGKHHAHD
jgi:hypothetical protein